MGQFDAPTRVQAGVTRQSPPGDQFTALGYQEKDLPYFGYGLHAEGLFSGKSPQEPTKGSPAEIYHHMIASGPKGDIGRSARDQYGPIVSGPRNDTLSR